MMEFESLSEFDITQMWQGRSRGSHWFRIGPMKVYLRKTFRTVGGQVPDTYDVASVEVEESERGKGHFTALLEVLEATGRWVYVESVLNDRLGDFLLRRGYKLKANSQPPCYYKESEDA